MPSRWEMPPVYLQSGDPETESTSTLHAPGLLGSRFTVIMPQRQQPGVETATAGRSKRYQLIKTASDASVAPYKGAVAYWTDRANYVVTTDPTASSLNDLAGVFCRTWEHAGDYMCVQVTGPKIVKTIDAPTGAVTAGAAVIGSATVSKADVLAVGVAPTYAVLGRAAAPLTYDLASRELLVDLDVPETT